MKPRTRARVIQHLGGAMALRVMPRGLLLHGWTSLPREAVTDFTDFQPPPRLPTTRSPTSTTAEQDLKGNDVPQHRSAVSKDITLALPARASNEQPSDPSS